MIEKQSELSQAIGVMLRYRLGKASVDWKYKDEVPMARVRKKEPVSIEVNGEPATAILSEGMLTDVLIQSKQKSKEMTKEEKPCGSSFFVDGKDAAEKWIVENYSSIIAKAKEAISLGYESYSLSTGKDPVINAAICDLLKDEHSFLGATVRRGKVIVAVNENALKEKPVRIRKRNRKAREAHQNRPESLLTGLAVNYVSENKSALMRLSEGAKAKGCKTFSLKPMGLDRDAWWYLARELKKQGFKDARVKRDKVVVMPAAATYEIPDEEFTNIF